MHRQRDDVGPGTAPDIYLRGELDVADEICAPDLVAHGTGVRDGLHTVSQRRLTERLGRVDDVTLEEICKGVTAALGCDHR